MNQIPNGGVLFDDVEEQAVRVPRDWLNVDQQVVEREFETCVIESSTLAFRVAYSVLRHREDAEDVAQEAFARAHRSFWRLRDRTRFRAWLVRTTWRLALDRRRSDLRRTARELGTLGSAQPPGTPQDVSQSERRAELWLVVDALPEKLRLVVVLAHVEGHTVAEVAQLLRIPEGTVKSRLYLARQRLKAQLSWMSTEQKR